MPTTVDFPTLVKQALELFGDVFDNEPARGILLSISPV